MHIYIMTFTVSKIKTFLPANVAMITKKSLFHINCYLVYSMTFGPFSELFTWLLQHIFVMDFINGIGL